MDNKFKMFVIIAIVVLSLGIACGLFAIYNISQGDKKEKSTPKEETIKITEVAVGEAIMTNISSDDGLQHFAKVQVKLGVQSSDKKAFEKFALALEEKAGSIRNELIATVGEQSYSTLGNVVAGKEKLKDEICQRLNKLLGTDLIKEVYIEEYFIQ